jgi:hypothetical protein
MTHPEELLADYVDGSLSDQDRALVETHLATCPRCRQETALAREAVSAIRSLPQAQAPPGLGQAAIEEAGAPSTLGVTSASSSRRHRFLALAAAAAVVAVIAIAVPKFGRTNQLADSAATAPTSQGSENTALGGQGSGAKLPLEVQQIDYNPTSAGNLAKAAARRPIASGEGPNVPVPNASGSAAGPADTQAALSCLGKAFTGFPGRPIRLIHATFQGKDAYIGVYEEGLPPGTISVRVVGVDGCSVLNYASAKI